jgi:iron complex transport system permease protein
VIAIAVWLAASITAEVGILGFVGLVAPTLAQLSGARRLKAKLIVAPAIGAVLLWLTDGCVSLLQTVTGDRLPVGAATALLGGPLLLWMLPRLRMFEWPSGKSEESAVRLKRAGLLRRSAFACSACCCHHAHSRPGAGWFCSRPW